MNRIHLLCAALMLLLSACISSYESRTQSASGFTATQSDVGVIGSKSSTLVVPRSAYQVCMDDYRDYDQELAKIHCKEVVETLHKARMNPCKPFYLGYGVYGSYAWPYAYPQPGTPCLQKP